MKPLFILLLFIVACGKDKDPTPTANVYHDGATVVLEEHVTFPGEVHTVLRLAAQRRRLWDYHRTRWFDNGGNFLFRSIVMSDETYRLEVP